MTPGRYRIVRELGRGGMGTVCEVEDPDLPGRRLALKRLHAGLLGPEPALRFLREAVLLARIRHPGVLTVHAGGQDEGGPWLVTDLIEGEPLEAVVARGPLPPARAAELVAQLGEAVEALHRAGLVHRDLKPHNVLVRPDGAPVLLDFGLARELDGDSLTRSGELLGTPAYMAPEQVRDPRTVDARADVYSLGAVLYALLAGRPPFRGSVVEVLLAAQHRGPDWPAGPEPALDAACRRAMARDPAARFASAGDLVLALRQGASPRRRSRWLLGAGLGLTLAGAAGLLLRSSPTPLPASPAEAPASPAEAPLDSRAAPAPPPLPEAPQPVGPPRLLPLPVDYGGGSLAVFLRGPGEPRLVASIRRQTGELSLWQVAGSRLEGITSSMSTELNRVSALAGGVEGVWLGLENGDVTWVGLRREGARAVGWLDPAQRVHQGTGPSVARLRSSPDGELLAVASRSPEKALLLLDRAGRTRWRGSLPCEAHALAFTPDQQGLAVVAGPQESGLGLIKWRQLSDGELRWRRDVAALPRAVAATPEGEILVGMRKGELLAFNGADGADRSSPWSGFSDPDSGTFVSIALLSRDGRRLFAVLSPQLSESDQVALWSLSGPAAPPVALRPGESVCTLDLSPDERFLLAGTSGPRMRLWEVSPP